ncbi:hypothetical protein DYB34_013529, partial [Aphanomyces astaci]
MEPNGIAQSGATMEHTKVSAKGKAKNKSTKENAKLKAPPRITATVQQLQNTTADGIQTLPDAGSVAQLELLQRIKFAYPSDSEDETKDDLDVANQLIQTYISMYGMVGLKRILAEHIRQYNAQFNFTSIGTNEVKHSGSGPKTYCIQGQLTHNIGPLQPSLNRIMDLHNPLARTYATAKERLRRAEADGTSGGNLQIVLKAVGGAQARTHNLPTVAQLAVIMEGDGSEPTEGRHVVLQSLNSNRFTAIRETNPLHDALQFPLLFPMGGPGWEYTMTKTDGKSLSLRAFFNYWLQERDGDDFSDMLHRSSMLFKMYTTVGFVRVETNRLRYISQNGD